MIVHIDKDLVNMVPAWEKFFAREKQLAAQAAEVEENTLAQKALKVIPVDEDMAVLFDLDLPEEITLVCPDRDDIYIFEGSPEKVKAEIGLED